MEAACGVFLTNGKRCMRKPGHGEPHSSLFFPSQQEVILEGTTDEYNWEPITNVSGFSSLRLKSSDGKFLHVDPLWYRG
jgi:hypothetical protein